MSGKAYPVFGIVLAFAFGIVLAEQLEIRSAAVSLATGGAFLLAFLWLQKASKKQLRTFSFLSAGCIYLLFGLLGLGRTLQIRPENSPKHLLNLPDSIASTCYLAFATDNARTIGSGRKAVTLQITAMKQGEQGWKATEGKLIAYLPKSDSLTTAYYGEEFLVWDAPQELHGAGNPHAFDYRAYLYTKGITHQHFLQKGEYLKTGKKRGHFIFAAAWYARRMLLKRFKENVKSQEGRAIGMALVLGVKDELNNDLRDLYSDAGVMHILAVSGLHVGIIVLILNFFSEPLTGFRHEQIWKGIVSLLALWAYAFITGLSPSVMRAVTMFSIFILGKMMHRRGNVYNTLSIAALVLLLYNPYMLYQVGFQLSFAAVLGIVWLQPFFSNWLHCKNEFTHWLWTLTTVSLSAQLFTLPLTLLYFHKFPTYFLLANLIAIPVAFFVVCNGLFILASSSIPLVSQMAGKLLSLVIDTMTSAMKILNSLFFAVIDNIYIDGFMAICLGGIIIFTGKLFINRRIKWLIPLLFAVICFSGWQFYHYRTNLLRKTLIIYQLRKSTNIGFLAKGQSTILTDSTIIAKKKHSKHPFYGDLLVRRLDPEQVLSHENEPPKWLNIYRYSKNFWIICWKGYKIGWLRGKIREKIPVVELDLVLVSHNAIYHLADAENIRASWLVIDATNGNKTSKNLLRQAKEIGIEAHAINEQGAWYIEL